MLENCEMYIGGNRDKILQIWTGEGDNGKSVTNKIIENKFGKLSVKFPKEWLLEILLKQEHVFQN